MQLTPAEQNLEREIYLERKDRKISNIKKAWKVLEAEKIAKGNGKLWNRVKKFFSQPFMK